MEEETLFVANRSIIRKILPVLVDFSSPFSVTPLPANYYEVRLKKAAAIALKNLVENGKHPLTLLQRNVLITILQTP